MVHPLRSSLRFPSDSATNSCTAALPLPNSLYGRASCHMGLCNTPFYWDATAGFPHKDGLSTFVHDNRPSQNTIHLEFAVVYAVSRSATLSLVPVYLVRPSGIPAPTGQYLDDMLPRDGFSSETEIFVASGYQNNPLSGLTDLERRPFGDFLFSPHSNSGLSTPSSPLDVTSSLRCYRRPRPARQHPRT